MRYIADKDGHWIPLERNTEARVGLQADFEFQLPDGQHIGGRRQWREHLKNNDCVEMGHSELKASQQRWNRRQAAEREALAKAAKYVRPVEGPPVRAVEPDRQLSRLNAEVRNRLDGRPVPDTKTLIKMTLEEARRR